MSDPEIERLTGLLTRERQRARKFKNQAHTWRLLYDDLLNKIATQLEITHDQAEAIKRKNK